MAMTTTKTLIQLAEYYHRYGQPVPVDVLSRLLEAGIDVRKFT